MRPQIVIISAGVAIGIVIVAFAVRHSLPGVPSLPSTNDTVISNVSSVPSTIRPFKPVVRVEGETRPSVQATNAAASASSAEDRQKIVREATAEIMQAAVDKSDNAISIISSKLRAPQREVRIAAIQGLAVLDDRAAIPLLEGEIPLANDDDEKEEIRKAIEQLKLPSLTELRNASKSGKSAMPK
jgi:hypothetical protein